MGIYLPSKEFLDFIQGEADKVRRQANRDAYWNCEEMPYPEVGLDD